LKISQNVHTISIIKINEALVNGLSNKNNDGSICTTT